MRIRATDKDLSQHEADLAVAFAYEGDRKPEGVADPRLRRELAEQMKADGFRGRPGDQLVWSTNGRFPSRRFLVIGLGPRGNGPEDGIRLGCARAARAAVEYSARTLAVRLPSTEDSLGLTVMRAATEGALLGAYRFDRHLTDPSRRPPELRSVELSAAGPQARLKRALRQGETAAQAVCLARDLVNEAPSRMTPRAMAAQARKQAGANGLRCKVLGRAELTKIGMGALLGVARGSAEPPQVVHLVYKPRTVRGRSRKRVLLVGKGVTFDSGGLDLKSADAMFAMKMDMAGAAAALATMTALSRLGCKIEVHALLGLAENMTGGKAYKPGDILKTYSGKTVEVANTDAEGRLVLADLLAWGARTLGPTQVVDLATLTGACVVALGLRASGLFSRHEPLREELLDAARSAGEKLWPMPMYDEYLQLLQKGPADLRNIAGRWGGAITAALFLGEFVPRDLPWAHVDIAGTAFTETELPDAPVGGTGAGVLTLLRWLEQA